MKLLVIASIYWMTTTQLAFCITEELTLKRNGAIKSEFWNPAGLGTFFLVIIVIQKASLSEPKKLNSWGCVCLVSHLLVTISVFTRLTHSARWAGSEAVSMRGSQAPSFCPGQSRRTSLLHMRGDPGKPGRCPRVPLPSVLPAGGFLLGSVTRPAA